MYYLAHMGLYYFTTGDEPKGQAWLSRMWQYNEMQPHIFAAPLTDWFCSYFHTTATMILDGEQIQIQPNHIVIWPAQSFRSFGNADEPWCNSWMHMSGNSLKKWADSSILLRPLPCANPTLFHKTQNDLFDEYSNHHQPDPFIVEHLIEIFFRQLNRLHSNTQEQTPETYLAIRRFILEHLNQQHSTEGLAAQMGLSSTQFSKQFRRYFDQPPIEFLINARIKQAQYLLMVHQRVQDVAQMVGYEDIYYFSRLFKKHVGVSPRKWREQQLALE